MQKGFGTLFQCGLCQDGLNGSSQGILLGLGIGQITSFQAERYLRSGALVQLLPEWTQPLLPVYVVYPPNRHLSAKVRAFVDWAAELFQREAHMQRTR